MNINEAVRDLRSSLEMSQQTFATALGLSMRAVANYEKHRNPDPRSLTRLEKLASENGHFDLARIFRDELGEQLGTGRQSRQPLTAEEHLLEEAFQRCVFENPKSTAAVAIKKRLQPFVEQIRKESHHAVARVMRKGIR